MDRSHGGVLRAPTTLSGYLTRHSRVLRLFRLLRARGRADLEVAIDPGHGDFQAADHRVRIRDREFAFGFERATRRVPGVTQHLVQNLGRLHAVIEESGARALFMTYPSRQDLYGQANRAIRLSARRMGVPLLNLTQIFREPCPLAACPTMFFADQHPTAEANRLVAKQVAAWIQAQR